MSKTKMNILASLASLFVIVVLCGILVLMVVFPKILLPILMVGLVVMLFTLIFHIARTMIEERFLGD